MGFPTLRIALAVVQQCLHPAPHGGSRLRPGPKRSTSVRHISLGMRRNQSVPGYQTKKFLTQVAAAEEIVPRLLSL